MNKYIIALLVVVLVLCAGCSNQEPAQTEVPAETVPATTAPAETTVPPTTEETVPVPELSTGYALADKTPAILDTLMRQDTVDVVGEYDEDHYVIKTDLGYGLIRKELVRMSDEAPYETWSGYAYYNAELYANLHLMGEPVAKLKTNTKVEVLDDLGYCYLVQVDDAEGFMLKPRISKRRITSSSGGGSSAGQDGGDITMQFQGGVTLLAAIEQSGDVTGQAVVLANGTEVILGYFNRGEALPLVAEDGFAESREGYTAVYLDGLYGYVPQWLIQVEAYEPWDGYSRWNSMVYDNFYLLGDPIAKLNSNAKVHVVEELETCYLVEVNNVTGYMAKDMVSKTKITSNGGSGNSGGGDNAWTPPAL